MPDDSIDEIIDGLRTKSEPGYKYNPRKPDTRATTTARSGQPVRSLDPDSMDDEHVPPPDLAVRHWSRWIWLGLGAVMALPIGAAYGGAEPPTKTRAPAPAVTVTKTVEKTVEHKSYPGSCVRAMELIIESLPHQDAIINAGVPELDIMRDAYQAILSKDFTKLNEATQRQIALRSDIAEHKHAVWEARPKITESINQCKSDIKNGGD